MVLAHRAGGPGNFCYVHTCLLSEAAQQKKLTDKQATTPTQFRCSLGRDVDENL